MNKIWVVACLLCFAACSDDDKPSVRDDGTLYGAARLNGAVANCPVALVDSAGTVTPDAATTDAAGRFSLTLGKDVAYPAALVTQCEPQLIGFVENAAQRRVALSFLSTAAARRAAQPTATTLSATPPMVWTNLPITQIVTFIPQIPRFDVHFSEAIWSRPDPFVGTFTVGPYGSVVRTDDNEGFENDNEVFEDDSEAFPDEALDDWDAAEDFVEEITDPFTADPTEGALIASEQTDTSSVERTESIGAIIKLALANPELAEALPLKARDLLSNPRYPTTPTIEVLLSWSLAEVELFAAIADAAATLDERVTVVSPDDVTRLIEAYQEPAAVAGLIVTALRELAPEVVTDETTLKRLVGLAPQIASFARQINVAAVAAAHPTMLEKVKRVEVQAIQGLLADDLSGIEAGIQRVRASLQAFGVATGLRADITSPNQNLRIPQGADLQALVRVDGALGPTTYEWSINNVTINTAVAPTIPMSLTGVTKLGVRVITETETTSAARTIYVYNSPTLVTPSATVTSIALTPASSVLEPSGSTALHAIAYFSDGSRRDVTAEVTWTSADTSVASVTNAGLVAAVGAGNTHVAAELQGATSQASIGVGSAPVAGLVITPAFTTLHPGLRQSFEARLVRTDGTSEDVKYAAAWTTSSTTAGFIQGDYVASIADLSGATQTVTATYNGYTATATIRQTNALVTQVAYAIACVEPGASVTLVPMATFADGSVHELNANVTSTQTSFPNGVSFGSNVVTAVADAELGPVTFSVQFGVLAYPATVTVGSCP